MSVNVELDQMMAQYRGHLRGIATFLTQLTQLGQCDVSMAKSAEDMVERLETAVDCLMDKQVLVEKARQSLLDLQMVLDISRQTVEAKSKHLGQEEKQKEEAQSLRFKEFQKIHKLQDEKVIFEKELVPAKRKLRQVTEILDEKNEKIRNLEHFHDALTEHCAWDMIALKDRTDDARADRAKWDQPDLDISKEIREFPLHVEDLRRLEKDVCELKESLQNHKQWYEEELQTKLFYSTRSKEIKHRINYYRNMIRRLEKSGRSEDTDEDHDERRLSRRSENILVDGSPGVQAQEVERYLSQQFGMKVLADYTMLRRLKDEIGVQGLAYLVEKIRLQGSCCVPSPSPVSRTPADWEEKRVEQALKNIAIEYRDREEHKRLLRVPGMGTNSPQPSDQLPAASLTSGWIFPSASCLSANSQATGHTPTPDASLASNSSSGRRSSSHSLGRKPSLARIKKFLKF